MTCPACDPLMTASDAHRRALEQHDRAYDDMQRMRAEHGRDSDEYREALASVRAAAKLLRPARVGGTMR